MKFTDGAWMMREGVRASYAAEAYQIHTTADEIVITAPTTNIRHRGDTLQGPVLKVRLSSPMEDVIRVKITHFEGGQDHGPHFEIAETSPSVHIQNNDQELSLTSGKLSVSIPPKSGWSLTFTAEGKAITKSPGRSTALMNVVGEGSYIQDQLTLGVGECVYGLGERFSAFVKNGQVVDIWNKDGGTGSDQAYKNIPFYMTNQGYGVFVNDSGPVSFEVASEKVSRVGFSVPGEALEYFVIYGPTPKEVLHKYTALTGRATLPPAWSFGLWLTTSFTTSYDEATINEFIDGMAQRDLPLHVFHFDCFWMRGFHWCDFEWDPDVFPAPTEMLARLHEKGLKVCVWINPYIAQQSALFNEGKAGGFLLKRANGDVWQWDMWQPGMAIVDFTNPAACDWFKSKLRALVKQGVDCFKTDFGERIPTDVVYHDGSDPVRMHNYYTQLYNQAVFEVMQEEGVDPVLFARSATVGGQKYPVHWGGDCWSDFESMAESLRGGLSLGMSGFGFWSHDIGGFEGMPPAAVYKRWIAFGLLSSHSRLHGSSSYRVPWLFDEEAVNVLRFFTKLKCRLMPYLFGQAVEARESGLPMMRAMHLEFPADRTCNTLDRQYMLGSSLLVAPVFSHEGMAEYYIPEGRWTSLLTATPYWGPKWVREEHGALSIPLLVAPNTILAVGGEDSRPDYDFTAGLTFEVYELAAKATCRVPNLAGEYVVSATAVRDGGQITFSVEGAANWSVLLVRHDSIRSASSGTVTQTERGTLISGLGGSVVVQT